MAISKEIIDLVLAYEQALKIHASLMAKVAEFQKQADTLKTQVQAAKTELNAAEDAMVAAIKGI